MKMLSQDGDLSEFDESERRNPMTHHFFQWYFLERNFVEWRESSFRTASFGFPHLLLMSMCECLCECVCLILGNWIEYSTNPSTYIVMILVRHYGWDYKDKQNGAFVTNPTMGWTNP